MCNMLTDDKVWLFQDVGSFSSDGGLPRMLWHHVEWGDFGDLSKIVSTHTIYVTAAVIRVVNITDDVAVTTPPIHFHHAHISVDRNHDYFKPRSLYFNGPDAGPCTRMEGGEDCALEEYPGGFGFAVSTELHVWCTFDDMRFFPADQLNFRVEAAVQYTMERLRPLSRWWSIGPRVTVKLHNPNRFTRGFHVIPPQQKSMWFYSIKTPTDATVVKMYFHTHMEQVRRLFMFQAAPHQIGLDHEKFRILLPSALPLTNVSLQTIEHAEEHIMDSFLRSAAEDRNVKLLCRLNGGAYEYVLVQGVLLPFARQATGLQCQPTVHLEKGQPLTFIVLYDTAAYDEPLPGHLHFWPTVYEHDQDTSRHLLGAPELHPV